MQTTIPTNIGDRIDDLYLSLLEQLKLNNQFEFSFWYPIPLRIGVVKIRFKRARYEPFNEHFYLSDDSYPCSAAIPKAEFMESLRELTEIF